MKAKYLLDSSVILRREEEEIYENSSFPIHWKNFDKLIEEGVIISLDSVKNEIRNNEYIYDDSFFSSWLKKYDFMFKEIDSSVNETMTILENKYDEWFSKLENEGNLTDFYLISYAKAHHLSLVTQETYNANVKKEKNYKIPIICKLEGANIVVNGMKHIKGLNQVKNYDFECICFTELIKREDLFSC